MPPFVQPRTNLNFPPPSRWSYPIGCLQVLLAAGPPAKKEEPLHLLTAISALSKICYYDAPKITQKDFF